MSKKALPVIIITVCLLFAGCKAPADQEQKNNTETAVLSTETQEEDWKQVHSTKGSGKTSAEDTENFFR